MLFIRGLLIQKRLELKDVLEINGLSRLSQEAVKQLPFIPDSRMAALKLWRPSLIRLFFRVVSFNEKIFEIVTGHKSKRKLKYLPEIIEKLGIFKEEAAESKDDCEESLLKFASLVGSMCNTPPNQIMTMTKQEATQFLIDLLKQRLEKYTWQFILKCDPKEASKVLNQYRQEVTRLESKKEYKELPEDVPDNSTTFDISSAFTSTLTV